MISHSAGKTPSKLPWLQRKVLITAGPTREYLDPIRFLTNSSSGMMGYALARAARDLGANVTVISGPARIGGSWGLKVVPVVTADQMHRAVLSHYRKSDVFISAAAVGDWKFERTSTKKIKKTGKAIQLKLVPNPDILLDVSKRLGPKRRTVLAGFALETSRKLEHAREKLRKKGLDLIVANGPESLGLAHARISIIDRWGGIEKLPPMSKQRAAAAILRYIERFL